MLAELQRQGLIRHIGLSNVTPKQFAQGQTIAEIVCVQNAYNVAHRNDDGFVDDLAAQGVAYVPFFPLGGFTPLQSSMLDDAAASLQATPMQLALAWLLQRSPNILLIPGTSSVAHLRENLKARSSRFHVKSSDSSTHSVRRADTRSCLINLTLEDASEQVRASQRDRSAPLRGGALQSRWLARTARSHLRCVRFMRQLLV